MLKGVVVAAAAHAVLAAYVAVALGFRARTSERRRLALALALFAIGCVLMATGYATSQPWSSVCFSACAVAVQWGATALCTYAVSLSGGLRVPVAVPGALGIAAALVCADASRRVVAGGAVQLHEALLSVLVLGTFVIVIVPLVAGARRRIPGARAFLLACLWPLVLLPYNVALNLMNDPSWTTYRLVKDIVLLLFCLALLVAYVDHGKEPMSLRDRVVAITLTCVLALVIAASQSLHGHEEALRLLLVELGASVLVIFAVPRLYEKSVLAPMAQLLDGLRKVEKGEEGVRVDVPQNDELGYMAAAFNRMTAALAEREGELRRQVAARSRELAVSWGGARRSADRLLPGVLVEDRYRIVRRLGGGGMGVVFEVERAHDKRRLALKVMSACSAPEDAARFAREAEIAATLHHPNLVPVVDVGIMDGMPFLVMDLVEGGDLADARDRFGDVAWALPLLAQLAEGVATLHAHGVVHRDLKPANVLVTVAADGPIVKITDFGIARREAIDALAATAYPVADVDGATEKAGITKTGAVIGTPLYMAPEIARGARHAGPAADVFAFGLMAYEMLSGHGPYPMPPILEALAKRALPDPPSLSEPVPEPVRNLLLAAVSADPERRPSATTLAEVLRDPANQKIATHAPVVQRVVADAQRSPVAWTERTK